MVIRYSRIENDRSRIESEKKAPEGARKSRLGYPLRIMIIKTIKALMMAITG